MISKFIGKIFLLQNYLLVMIISIQILTLIVDDIIENNQKQKLSDFIEKWIQDKIN